MEATRHTGMETLGTLGWTLQRHWDGDVRDIKVEAPGKLEDTEIETSRDAEMETIRDTGQRPLGILRERDTLLTLESRTPGTLVWSPLGTGTP